MVESASDAKSDRLHEPLDSYMLASFCAVSWAISVTFERVYSENTPLHTTETTHTMMSTVMREVSANESAMRVP